MPSTLGAPCQPPRPAGAICRSRARQSAPRRPADRRRCGRALGRARRALAFGQPVVPPVRCRPSCSAKASLLQTAMLAPVAQETDHVHVASTVEGQQRDLCREEGAGLGTTGHLDRPALAVVQRGVNERPHLRELVGVDGGNRRGQQLLPRAAEHPAAGRVGVDKRSVARIEDVHRVARLLEQQL